jgi:hypothetical protein
MHEPHNVDSFQEQFKKAMEIVGKVFLDRVLYCKNSWLPARELVEEALNGRNKVTSKIKESLSMKW